MTKIHPVFILFGLCIGTGLLLVGVIALVFPSLFELRWTLFGLGTVIALFNFIREGWRRARD